MNKVDTLRREFVYPGHPLVIAFLMTKTYDGLSAALAPTDHNRYHALGSQYIPGAGGNVYAAIDFLGWIRKGTFSIEESILHADKYWKSCDGMFQRNEKRTQDETYHDVWKRGQAQADELKPALMDRLVSWIKH